MPQSRIVSAADPSPADTLKHLLAQRRECGSAEFDSALWLATVDWLAARARQRVTPWDASAHDGGDIARPVSRRRS